MSYGTIGKRMSQESESSWVMGFRHVSVMSQVDKKKMKRVRIVTWIQWEWDLEYIERSKQILQDLVSTWPILMFIHWLSTLDAQVLQASPIYCATCTTKAPTKLPPYAKTLTCFQLKDHPIYPGLNSSDPMGGVEDEFTKYTSGPLMSCKTDILVYWEVSPVSHLIRLVALLQLALLIGPQVGIPYPVCYCHELPSDPSVFCPMWMHLLISWGDQYQETKSDQPSLNGGSTN